MTATTTLYKNKGLATAAKNRLNKKAGFEKYGLDVTWNEDFTVDKFYLYERFPVAPTATKGAKRTAKKSLVTEVFAYVGVVGKYLAVRVGEKVCRLALSRVAYEVVGDVVKVTMTERYRAHRSDLATG